MPKSTVLLFIAVALFSCNGKARTENPTRPNFVIFFTDDQGYNDVGVYGSPLIKTPNFDRMAAEGMRFTSFYAQPVCGPSRAALMTGSYPIRTGEPGNIKHEHTMLHPEEVTMAEALKTRGYATALIGKWHLAGSDPTEARPRGRGPFPPELMPNAQGFDYFYGTPMHNGTTREPEPEQYVTILMRNGDVIRDPAGMDALTRDYTREALEFIRKNKDRPFFLYLAHNMPHVVLGASEEFRGKSPRGLYGDVVQELDWSMGRVLATLKELDLDEKTLVVLASDNGPWIEERLGDHAGSADPLRGWKMSAWEGGSRVPGIMRWPGTIPAGAVSDEIVTTMDLLPTFAALAGARLPGRKLDGEDITPLITGKVAERPNAVFCFYAFTHLQAVRRGKWKLIRPRPEHPLWTSWNARMIDGVDDYELYDLDADISESHNVAAEHPEVLERMKQLVEEIRNDLGDYDKIGEGARFFDDGPKRPRMQEWIDKHYEPSTP